MAEKNDPLADARKRQAEIVAEQEEAQSIQPTPTPEEVDRAKLGLTDDEPKKSEAPKTETRTTEAAKPTATYQTRSAGKND